MIDNLIKMNQWDIIEEINQIDKLRKYKHEKHKKIKSYRISH